MSERDGSSLTSLHDLLLVENSRALLGRYALAVDSTDIEAIVGLFELEGVLDIVHTQYTGRDQIREFYTQAMATNIDRRHFVTTNSITVQGMDLVEAHSYFWFTFVGDGEPILGWGQYLDQIQVTHSGPFFRYRRIILDHRLEIPATRLE